MAQTNSQRAARIAVLRLHLPDGTVLKRQVVEEQEGVYVRHFPLVEELPNTTWLRSDYYVPSSISTDAPIA
ncbi:MAG: hypothetical protein IJ786_04565 [Bacteroidaceae bacterium]|nr:hypothetical protein [Bacteroidaceae bacterium]